MKNQPEVSIISVNYNGLKDTCELIESIRDNLTISYELIIVDNASKANEASLIEERYPWVRVVRNKRNLGFAGGNNAGISISKGKFIFLLNNDTIIKDDSIHFLTEKLDSDSSIGAVSPKIKFAFPPENIQYSGYTSLTSITLRNRTIGFGEKDLGQYEVSAPMPYLHGAAIMVKREVIEKAGLIPEIYFLYYEEMDWCTKITRSGYILYYEPRCTVYHKESQSTGQSSPLRTFFITRNRLLYAFRNLKGISRYLSIAYLMTVSLFKNSITFLWKGRIDLIKATISGVFSFIIIKNKTD
jgi:hypothetical protein